MNFQQLEYILAVDQHNHFGKAADSYHVTQATLSGMIKKLKGELGIIIFDRSHKPIKTTDEGKEAIELARKILGLQTGMNQLELQTESSPQGVLRVGIIPTIANSLLPIILPSLFKKFPDLHLKVVEITTDQIIQQLKSDTIDAGILATPLEDEVIEENILYYEAKMVYGVNKSNKKYLSTKAIQDQKI